MERTLLLLQACLQADAERRQVMPEPALTRWAGWSVVRGRREYSYMQHPDACPCLARSTCIDPLGNQRDKMIDGSASSSDVFQRTVHHIPMPVADPN